VRTLGALFPDDPWSLFPRRRAPRTRFSQVGETARSKHHGVCWRGCFEGRGCVPGVMHEEGDVTPAGLLNSGGEVLVGEGQGVHINQAPFVSARGLPVRHAVRPAAGGGRRGCEVAARTEDGAERGGARRVGAGVSGER